MVSRTIKVINNSKHEWEVVKSEGTSISANIGKKIKAGETVEIGSIEIPEMWRKDGNNGSWYVRDILNMATFKLYVSVSSDNPLSAKKNDDYNVGLLGIEKSHQEFFETKREESNGIITYYFTIKSMWTDNPPSYVFNYGHYGITSIGDHETAAHTYIIVRSFNGDKTIKFECWGGAAEEPRHDAPNLCYPAMTFLGGEYELALARTICCFNPADKRDDYGLRFSRDGENVKPEGRLKLGDCYGIIYGRTGVCHQMANRICRAVADFDVGDRANVPAYKISKLVWNTFGGGKKEDYIDALDKSWRILPDRFKDNVVSDDDLKKLDIPPNSPLYFNFGYYFAECIKLVEEAGYKKR